jgi:hypothetical protein
MREEVAKIMRFQRGGDEGEVEGQTALSRLLSGSLLIYLDIDVLFIVL